MIDFKRFLKNFITAITSRKFIAWAIATVLCVFKIITGEIWLTVTGLYLAANVTQKIGTKVQGEGQVASTTGDSSPQ